jgi:LacI family transcriptional regulator
MTQTRKRVTIKEVAQAAGVSTQTVSRVLNDRRDVSAETRERIRGIIDEMGYSPNVLARSLIQGRSHTLGVVGYGLSYYGPSRVLTGIERRANELGYSLLLSLLREPDTNDGKEIFHNLSAHQVDGIIWAVPEIGSNRAWAAEQLNNHPGAPGSVPVVFINMEPAPGLAAAAMDNREGGRLATEHLLSQGYRQIGIITGPCSWWEAQQRELGWREAMQAAGASICDPDSLKAVGDWYPASGEKGLQELLARCPGLEAVFACNDPMAAGALLAARRLGLRVPEDLAVVGFDDVPEAAFYYPSLTTIRQPLAELGGQAVDMLNDFLSDHLYGRESEPPQTVWLHPKLVIRDSSSRNKETSPDKPGSSLS